MNEEKIRAVRKIQDYIEGHYDEVLTLLQLSKLVNYSPFYTSKIFKELTGKTLFDYIRARRLTKAALVLRDEEKKVIDVAFDFVFDSHEGFTRAFSRQFGLAPSRYKKEKSPISLFIPFPVEHLKHKKRSEEDMRTVFTQVIERPKRKLILKRGVQAKDYFAYCEEVGCDVWGILSSIKEALYEPVGVWLPENLRLDNTSEYAQGVEVPFDYSGLVPEGFDLIDLKACQYMIFQGQPYDDAYFQDEVMHVMQAIENYDPTLYGFKWDLEIGPRFQLEPRGFRGYIEGKPVKRI